ncbi:hypothetical protein ACVB8X_27325 [Streptomyces sp. NRAIS4]
MGRSRRGIRVGPRADRFEDVGRGVGIHSPTANSEFAADRAALAVSPSTPTRRRRTRRGSRGSRTWL